MYKQSWKFREKCPGKRQTSSENCHVWAPAQPHFLRRTLPTGQTAGDGDRQPGTETNPGQFTDTISGHRRGVYETGKRAASPGWLKAVLSVNRRKRFISQTESNSCFFFFSSINFIRVNCRTRFFCAAGKIITVPTSGKEFVESGLVLRRRRSRNPSALLILL